MTYPKNKYNFHDWKYKSDGLPEGANALVKDKVGQLKCDELLVTIDKYEKKRWYGKILVYDARGVPLSEIQIDAGVCRKFDFVDHPTDPRIVAPLRVVSLISIRNDVWSFRKTENAQRENPQ